MTVQTNWIMDFNRSTMHEQQKDIEMFDPWVTEHEIRNTLLCATSYSWAKTVYLCVT